MNGVCGLEEEAGRFEDPTAWLLIYFLVTSQEKQGNGGSLESIYIYMGSREGGGRGLSLRYIITCR